jgi:hypothetical protein
MQLRRVLPFLLFSLLALVAMPALAQPKGAEQPASAPTAEAVVDLDEPPPVTAEQKQEAKRRFLRGLKLLREEAWAAANAEFKKSRELFPTRVATINSAVALRKLQRFDEALEMYETLLRDFKVKPKDRESALRNIVELRSLVGTIDIAGAVAGATITIAGKSRGQYPPVKPIRVPAGNHVVRLFKAGFQAYETTVDVAGGELAMVKAKMPRLTDSGRLQIREETGRVVEVVVDGVAVGKTPYASVLSVGSHVVSIRGKGKLGSQPAAAVVKSGQTTSLSLLAVPLDGSLQVIPTPPGASVWIDSVNVGNGVWLGRLKTGRHNIEVKSDGFLTAKRKINLAKGRRKRIKVSLEKDDEAPKWRKPSRWTIDVTASALLVPSFGGDVAGSCSDACQRDLGVGTMGLIHGSYELGSGLGIGIEAGYMLAAQQVRDRPATFNANGLPPQDNATLDDALRVQGFMAGATLGYHFGERFPIVAQLGAGALIAKVRDERSGDLSPQTAPDQIHAFETMASVDNATYVYVRPGIRVGFKILPQLELSADLSAMMMIGVTQPRFDDKTQLKAGADGVGSYNDDSTFGSFVVGISPGLNLRWATRP